ncbi:MAG: hypothetical protein KAU20_07905 [Nanoarchaeota archaeon]|nr:hypothetical protein [Nanoarchaeota archaeon]
MASRKRAKKKKENILDTAREFLKYSEARKLMLEIKDETGIKWDLEITEKAESYASRQLTMTWQKYGMIDENELTKVLGLLMKASVKYSVSIFGSKLQHVENEMKFEIDVR